MKKMVAIVLILLVLICSIVCISIFKCVIYKTKNVSNTQRNEIDFFRALLYAKAESPMIPIENLVPVEWDYMKVFCAYATKEDKIEFAGYIYADDIQDIGHEDILSLLFFKDGKVVYYVDALVPRMFEYEMLENGLVKMSTKGWYFVEIDSAMCPEFSSWGFYPQIEEACIEDNPHFVIDYRNDTLISLTLQCLG